MCARKTAEELTQLDKIARGSDLILDAILKIQSS
jgi:hypothetical protein